MKIDSGMAQHRHAGLLRRIFAGGSERKSRLHDEKGNRVDLNGIAYLPAALCSALLLKLSGRRPPVPWISYRAKRVIDSLLTPSAVVLEFGSGHSTTWFAARCAKLFSIEHDAGWYAAIQEVIEKEGIRNIEYRQASGAAYSDLSRFPDYMFDFVLIDGIDRGACAAAAIAKMKAGAYAYLDNSDKHANQPGADTRNAEAALLEAVQRTGGSVRYFVDFSPTQVFAQQGMLIRLGR